MTWKSRKTSLYEELQRAQNSRPPNENQPFLSLSAIDQIITENATKGALSRNLWYWFDRQSLQDILKCAKKVFAILVEIEMSGEIRGLLADGLNDGHLPLSRPTREHHTTSKYDLVSHKGKVFHSFASWKSQPRINQFLEKQWICMAPIVNSSGSHIALDPKQPLPFSEWERQGSTLSSTVWKGKIDKAHLNLKRQGFEEPTCQVATKEFHNPELFEKERENLEKIQDLNHEHLITHYATYQRQDKSYVIFPWASGGNLRDFWQHQDGRIRNADLAMWSLRQILGLASALKALHTDALNFRHGDLKPENILHFPELDSPGVLNGRLVIADVGISRIHVQETKVRKDETTTRATTPSYEAPEATTHPKIPRSRKYDIWSMGCILLEFALWILHDMEVTNSLFHARSEPTLFYLPPRSTTAPKGTAEIHPMATYAIENLRKDARCSGNTAFGSFIDLISQDLLQIDVDSRISAAKMVEKLDEIIRRAEKDPSQLFNPVFPPPERLAFPRRVGISMLTTTRILE